MYNLMYATYFYPGFRCHLSPTASFVCKKPNKQKTKQSELQPETKMLNAGKAHKGPDKFGRYIIFLRTL